MHPDCVTPAKSHQEKTLQMALRVCERKLSGTESCHSASSKQSFLKFGYFCFQFVKLIADIYVFDRLLRETIISACSF